MTFGLGVFKSSGGLTYSSDDVTWNQVDMVFLPGGFSGSGNFPALSGREVLIVQMMIDPPPLDRKAIAFTITVQGTTVYATGGSENTYVLVLMR